MMSPHLLLHLQYASMCSIVVCTCLLLLLLLRTPPPLPWHQLGRQRIRLHMTSLSIHPSCMLSDASPILRGWPHSNSFITLRSQIIPQLLLLLPPPPPILSSFLWNSPTRTICAVHWKPWHWGSSPKSNASLTNTHVTCLRLLESDHGDLFYVLKHLMGRGKYKNDQWQQQDQGHAYEQEREPPKSTHTDHSAAGAADIDGTATNAGA